VIRHEFTFDEKTQTETLTGTVTVKQTYKQEWSAPNKAQTTETEKFVELLAELCKGIEEPEQKMGRLPLADVVFAWAQVNEALCKILCHNICCLIQSIFELGIEPTFWAPEA
jgi:hypothetical protein